MADSLTLDADDVAFLAARLRRLFVHFGVPLPRLAASDDSLIRIAGSLLGQLLAVQEQRRQPVHSADPSRQREIAAVDAVMELARVYAHAYHNQAVHGGTFGPARGGMDGSRQRLRVAVEALARSRA